LRLFPGEETLFELKVVNHGDPSNISIEASDPLIKALRLKGADRHIETEENIPVLARLPEDRKRVDGEILISSRDGISRIPVSLIQDSEGEEGKWGMGIKSRGNMRKRFDEDPEDSEEYPSDSSSDSESRNDDSYEFEEEPGKESGGREYSDPDDESEKLQEEDSKSEEDRAAKDVENYRAMRRRRRSEYLRSQGVSENGDPGGPGRGQGQSRSQDQSQDYERNHGRDREPDHGQNYEEDSSVKYYSETLDEPESSDESAGSRLALNLPGGVGIFQTVPLAILACLILIMTLTFYSGSIPEFPGALASSVLIVTLIIYGAATLLKA